MTDTFSTRADLDVGGRRYVYASLPALGKRFGRVAQFLARQPQGGEEHGVVERRQTRFRDRLVGALDRFFDVALEHPLREALRRR